MASFSDRLKELRTAKGETQISMAKLLGCTEQHYQRFEYGKVTPNAIILTTLADHFGVSVDYLLGRTNYWMDADGHIHTKVPPDIFNLDTDAFKTNTNSKTN